MRPFYFWLFISLLLSSHLAFAAPFEAGLGVTAETSGPFFSPKLTQLTVVEVKAQSPAEKAGILVGEKIIAINDCEIPGCPAKKAKAMTQSAPLELTLMNAQGETRKAVIRTGTP